METPALIASVWGAGAIAVTAYHAAGGKELMASSGGEASSQVQPTPPEVCRRTPGHHFGRRFLRWLCQGRLLAWQSKELAHGGAWNQTAFADLDRAQFLVVDQFVEVASPNSERLGSFVDVVGQSS